jgi:hypothetical protein
LAARSTLADISQLASAEQPRGADDAADAAILGDAVQATLSINRYLDAGGNPISALRTLHFRMLRVSDAVCVRRRDRHAPPPAHLRKGMGSLPTRDP